MVVKSGVVVFSKLLIKSQSLDHPLCLCLEGLHQSLCVSPGNQGQFSPSYTILLGCYDPRLFLQSSFPCWLQLVSQMTQEGWSEAGASKLSFPVLLSGKDFPPVYGVLQFLPHYFIPYISLESSSFQISESFTWFTLQPQFSDRFSKTQ